jgi:hypothetical protein
MSPEAIIVTVSGQESGFPRDGVLGRTHLVVKGLARGGRVVTLSAKYIPGEHPGPGAYCKARGLSQEPETALIDKPALLDIPEVIAKL